MNKRNMISFIIVSFFLLSIITTINATEDNSTNTAVSSQITSDTQPVSTTDTKSSDTKIKEDQINHNTIQNSQTKKSKDIRSTNKQAKKDTTVNNYQELYNTIETINTQTQTQPQIINLNTGNYNITDPIIITNTTGSKTITINGNDQTINGLNSKQFLVINPSITLTINNLIIINTSNNNASAILNHGNLTLNNTHFNNNNATENGIIISENANLTILNSQFIENGAGGNGSITYNNNTTVIINQSTFNNNIALNGGCNFNYQTNMIITNSEFNHNQAGNASCNFNTDNSNLTIVNATFNHNQAALDGGVNVNMNSSDIQILNTSFIYNNATYAGVNYNENTGTITVINSYFNNNGAVYGGVNCNYGAGDFIIRYANFTNNSAAYGGIDYNDIGNIIIQNIISENNTANYGGVIYNHKGKVNITNTNYKNNQGFTCGGVIYNFDNAEMSIENTTFTNSKAQPKASMNNAYGGVIYSIGQSILNITSSTFNNNTANYQGGAIYNNGILTINNTNFINNTALNNGSAINNKATLTIENSTLTNNFDENNATIYTTQNITLKNNNITNIILTVVDNITPLTAPIINTQLTENVTFKFSQPEVVNVNNNIYKITQNYTSTGNYTVTTDYPTYSTDNTIQLVVQPARLNQTLKVNINSEQTTLNNLTINATILDSNNNTITQPQKVVIKMNDVTQKHLNITDGKINTQIDTSDFTAKKYNVTIIVGEDNRYNTAEYTQNLEIVNRNATINFTTNTPQAQGNLIVNVNVKDTNNKTTINNGFIIYKINGCTLRDENGKEIRTNIIENQTTLNFTIPQRIGQGTYNITCKYISNYYNRVENITFNLTITPIKIQNTTINNITTKQYQNTTLNLTLKDEYNQTLKGTILAVVKINGVTYNKTNITDGKLNVVLKTEDFKNPTYKITIKTGPSPIYNQVQLDFTLNVEKQNTTTNTTSNTTNTKTNKTMKTFIDDEDYYNNRNITTIKN